MIHFRVLNGLIIAPFNKQTLKNMLYLGLGFPLGILYLVLFAVCLGIIAGLLFTPMTIANDHTWGLLTLIRVAGAICYGILTIPILLLILWIPALLESHLAAWLIATPRDERSPHLIQKKSLFKTIGRYLLSRASWKNFLFGLIRIPLSLGSFILLISSLSILVALVFMPVIYLLGFKDLILGIWRIDSPTKAAIACILGIIMVPALLHLLNLVVHFHSWLVNWLNRDQFWSDNQ